MNDVCWREEGDVLADGELTSSRAHCVSQTPLHAPHLRSRDQQKKHHHRFRVVTGGGEIECFVWPDPQLERLQQRDDASPIET